MSDQSLPKRYACLFIDVPNVCHRNTESAAQKFAVSDIDWELLIDRMLSTLEAAEFVYIGMAYVHTMASRVDARDRLLEGLRRGLGKYRGEVTVDVRMRKDIDADIVNDMWRNLIQLVRKQHDSEHGGPLEVTILLAGGDSVYARPIRGIREQMPEVKLRLHTFAWSNSLSAELSKESQFFEFLEQTPLVVKRPAALTG